MERRKQPRKAIGCQVYFICISADGHESVQDIGVARDISRGGMMLETAAPINTTDVRILASTSDNQQMDILGGVIYSMEIGAGKYSTGIFFQTEPEEAAKFVEQLMVAAEAG
jgi:chemotaxis protein CheY-P-specific phosphatase CheC